MLGSTLRAERERQNLSFEDIEQGTSIRALYIEAIENGEYDELPGEVYTRGFIKNYAKFLGLDGDAFAKEFTAEIHGAQTQTPVDNPVEEVSFKEEKSVKPVKPEKSAKPDKPEKKSKVVGEIHGQNRSSSGVLVVAAVVLIAALAGGAWSFLSSDSDVAGGNNLPAQTQPVQPENPTPVANANPAPPAPSDGVKIEANFKDRCWTLVTVDGAVVLEGVVEAGEKLSWEGKDNISLRLGDAGAVELIENGQNLGVQGGAGEVVDKTFTKK